MIKNLKNLPFLFFFPLGFTGVMATSLLVWLMMPKKLGVAEFIASCWQGAFLGGIVLGIVMQSKHNRHKS